MKFPGCKLPGSRPQAPFPPYGVARGAVENSCRCAVWESSGPTCRHGFRRPGRASRCGYWCVRRCARRRQLGIALPCPFPSAFTGRDTGGAARQLRIDECGPGMATLNVFVEPSRQMLPPKSTQPGTHGRGAPYAATPHRCAAAGRWSPGRCDLLCSHIIDKGANLVCNYALLGHPASRGQRILTCRKGIQIASAR